MPRYIDADKLRDEVDGTLNWETNNEYNMYSDIMDMIDYAPTEDVQPVKHGRWITSEITTDSGCTSCSCCHSEYYIGDLQNLEGDNDFVMYCPNCGARMDGDGNDV